ncbi:hypothetical protein [Micromonospora aurantiaca (nom. illeg.)]|uniref:hypothetical protein n=1 Tax=Micromonospora aurantiaca (nom. illeg.) TaxID=47850 RepID=UPI003F49E87D
MTPDEQTEWQERLRKAVEDTIRRRQEQARIRADHQRRRAHGLRQRHRRKLNRRKEQP